MNEDVKELVERIVKETEMEEEKVVSEIEAKEEEYDGLISQEGAAHIVAKESGIELMGNKSKSLDIDNIVSGMNNVNVTGKIVSISDTTEFETDDGKGKVANVTLGDETGRIRLSLWNDQVEGLIDEDKIEEGQVIKIENGYVKKDNRDNPELRLGNSGQIKKSDEEIDVEVEPSSSGDMEVPRGKIEELSPGERAEIRGTLVKIFGNDPFYKTCPECGNRVEDECEEHGKSEINIALSGVMDDGTGSIRSVFFGEIAEKLIDMDTEEAWDLSDGGESMDEFMIKVNENLGEELLLEGRIQMNDFFGRPELIVNSLERADATEEAKKILASI